MFDETGPYWHSIITPSPLGISRRSRCYPEPSTRVTRPVLVQHAGSPGSQLFRCSVTTGDRQYGLEVTPLLPNTTTWTTHRRHDVGHHGALSVHSVRSSSTARPSCPPVGCSSWRWLRRHRTGRSILPTAGVENTCGPNVLEPDAPVRWLTTDAVSDLKFLLPPGATLPAGMSLSPDGVVSSTLDVTTGTASSSSVVRALVGGPPHRPSFPIRSRQQVGHCRVSYSTPCT
jgi:hypothetical protein